MDVRRKNRSMDRFVKDDTGNVATILALSFVPLILLVGASIDYTRAVTKKSSLQQATDATILAVAHNLTQNLTSAQLTTSAQNYFAAAVSDSNAWIVSGPTVSAGNTQVCMTTRTNVPTTIMAAAAGAGMGATPQVTVAANACAKINNITYEVALALDNSGSMNESTSGTTKMVSLQTAATQMVSILNPPGQLPKASFSIVPFSSAVNVGTGYANASWMDTAGQSSIHWQNFQMPLYSKYKVWVPTSKFDFFNNSGVNTLGQAWGGCVEERPAPYMTTDTPSTASNPDTLFVPYLYPDEGGSNPLNNYLSDSGGSCTNNDTYAKADNPSTASQITVTNTVANTLRNDGQTKVCKYKNQAVSGANSLFSDINGNTIKAGPNLLCDSRPITTLTNDNTVLTSQIAALYSRGDTNLVSGFMWAWRTISPNGPFNGFPAVSVGPQNPKPYPSQVITSSSTATNVKVIVMMTDGYNHWANYSPDPNSGAYSSFGFYANGRLGATTASTYRTLMDNATLSACTNAKAAGVQIYTVGFSIPSDPIDSAGLSLLQNCASQTSMAYIAQDGSALVAVFSDIARSMSGLRLVN